MVESIEFNVFVAIDVRIGRFASLVLLEKGAVIENQLISARPFTNYGNAITDTHLNTLIQYCFTKSTF